MTGTPPLARSPLHAWHEAHGARFGQHHGWLLAQSFPGVSWSSGLRLADVTPFAKASITGNDVSELARAALADPQPGKVAAVAGTSPGWLCYLSEEHLLFLSTRLDAEPDTLRIPNQREDARPITWNVTSAYAGCLLIDDNAAQLISYRLNPGRGPATLVPGSCVETGFFGVNCVLARLDERSVGVWVPWDVAEYAWERLRELAPAAAPLGITALGDYGWHA